MQYDVGEKTVLWVNKVGPCTLLSCSVKRCTGLPNLFAWASIERTVFLFTIGYSVFVVC